MFRRLQAVLVLYAREVWATMNEYQRDEQMVAFVAQQAPIFLAMMGGELPNNEVLRLNMTKAAIELAETMFLQLMIYKTSKLGA